MENFPLVAAALSLFVIAADEGRQNSQSSEVVLRRSGTNDCVDLPAPPEGVRGLREYARVTIDHDGEIIVRAAQLPFSINDGYVYRLTPKGWMKNEADYILLRTPVPVKGGFVYLLTFGGGDDRCGPWSIDATHPR